MRLCLIRVLSGDLFYFMGTGTRKDRSTSFWSAPIVATATIIWKLGFTVYLYGFWNKTTPFIFRQSFQTRSYVCKNILHFRCTRSSDRDHTNCFHRRKEPNGFGMLFLRIPTPSPSPLVQGWQSNRERNWRHLSHRGHETDIWRGNSS